MKNYKQKELGKKSYKFRFFQRLTKLQRTHLAITFDLINLLALQLVAVLLQILDSLGTLYSELFLFLKHFL